MKSIFGELESYYLIAVEAYDYKADKPDWFWVSFNDHVINPYHTIRVDFDKALKFSSTEALPMTLEKVKDLFKNQHGVKITDYKVFEANFKEV